MWEDWLRLCGQQIHQTIAKGKQKHTEEEMKEENWINWYDSISVNEQEAHLIYMHMTYWLSIL